MVEQELRCLYCRASACFYCCYEFLLNKMCKIISRKSRESPGKIDESREKLKIVGENRSDFAIFGETKHAEG